MEERYSRKILKTAVYQIIVIASFTYARVGMKSGNYRVFITLSKCFA